MSSAKIFRIDVLSHSLVSNWVVVRLVQIFSNGKYRSVLHRVVVNPFVPRMSVASLHSFPAGTVVRPAPQLINEANPRRYIDTDYAAFLNHLLTRESKGKNFVESRAVFGPKNKDDA